MSSRLSKNKAKRRLIASSKPQNEYIAISLHHKAKLIKIMDKKQNKKIKQNFMDRFVPLSDIVARKLKDPQFRKAYTEEVSRLQLAYEIRMLRAKQGMTQGQVASKAKMPQSVVARIESGSRGFSIATLHKIAKVFGREIGLVAPRQG